MVVSPRYRRRFEAETHLGEGRGVEIEAMIVREEIARGPRASATEVRACPAARRRHRRHPAAVAAALRNPLPRARVGGGRRREIVRLLRRGFDGQCGRDAAHRGDRIHGALWLSLTGGRPPPPRTSWPPSRPGATSATTPRTTRLAHCITAEPAGTVALLQRLGRTLPSVLPCTRRSYGPRPRVTVGGHSTPGPAPPLQAPMDGHRCSRAPPARCATRRCGHCRVRGAACRDVRRTPRPPGCLPAVPPRRGEGPPVHLSVPGLSRCPDLPPEPGPPLPNQAAAGPTVVGDHGRIYVNSVDRSENLHIVAGRDVIMMGDRDDERRREGRRPRPWREEQEKGSPDTKDTKDTKDRTDGDRHAEDRDRRAPARPPQAAGSQ